MSIELRFDCGARTPSELYDLVAELARELEQVRGAEVELAPGANVRGTRGETVTIGQVLITFITSGAAVAALNVFKTYFEREPELKLSYKTPEGKTVEITAKQLSERNTELALRLFESSSSTKP